MKSVMLGCVLATVSGVYSRARREVGKRARGEKRRIAKIACIVSIFWAATATGAQAQTFKTLHSFDLADGQWPYASLLQGTNGNFYGTTYIGGANCINQDGCGTVFEITPKGKLTTLYSFDGADGIYPNAGLVQGTNGNFYGTTSNGGECFNNGNCGTVFEVTPTGKLTTLYTFCTESGDCADGLYPNAGLVRATNGNFYGTTVQGGAYAGGTVFEITPKGKLTTLHSFCSESGCPDGLDPYAALIQATSGKLYGTTAEGGAYGGGTVFEITPEGKLTTLYSFCNQTNCTEGYQPYAGLIEAANGDLYGTTVFGGTCDDHFCGTVFKITPKGKLTTLHNFCLHSNCPDGQRPYAGLILATNGKFYGTTWGGGLFANCQYGCGTVFEITPSGKLTTLHRFCDETGCPDGDGPYVGVGLFQATNGNLYGTALNGGANNDGTVFSVSVGLGPFVETQPTSGKVGVTVIILGNNLTGSTAVSFNGTVANFKVVRNSEIMTTVPTGANTGTVEVTTPRGILNSSVVFRVTK